MYVHALKLYAYVHVLTGACGRCPAPGSVSLTGSDGGAVNDGEVCVVARVRTIVGESQRRVFHL